MVAGCGGGGGGGGGTPPPPPVSSVAISPAAAQSINVGGTVTFSAQTVPSGRSIIWTSSDLTKISLSATTGSPITATGVAAGSSQIRATSEGFPSTAVTVTVTAGGGPNPDQASVTATANDTFDPATVTIRPGGTVTWTFVPNRDHNVTFAAGGPQPTGGNISTTNNTTVARNFPNAGTYGYTCTLHAGMNGTVNVQ